jgi:hypothetical protein
MRNEILKTIKIEVNITYRTIGIFILAVIIAAFIFLPEIFLSENNAFTETASKWNINRMAELDQSYTKRMFNFTNPTERAFMYTYYSSMYGEDVKHNLEGGPILRILVKVTNENEVIESEMIFHEFTRYGYRIMSRTLHAHELNKKLTEELETDAKKIFCGDSGKLGKTREISI